MNWINFWTGYLDTDIDWLYLGAFKKETKVYLADDAGLEINGCIVNKTFLSYKIV